ncbi:uncharacterized protein LY89DRAFT_717476 [Mollisia scopiformis]|uniref:2EXR domain-containing protein n=1 Tax=Mollisia scopiformis TaxID=149040 RepID=A0A194XFS9_MOLSC|nr:uncharacterized protein LY89DRAFT_717476 [Mollisia scopiformis]KUJ18984.1 hypothetical protein LY89DRAFT_717476 [Mollisia scopiformis]
MSTNPTSEDVTPNQLIESPNMVLAFTLFPNLPVELRLKIWKEAAHITRNVDIWIRRAKLISDDWLVPNLDHLGYPRSYFYFISASPIPSILHVSHESRSEALIHYQLDFATSREIHRSITSINDKRRDQSFEAHTYINWKVDRVCFMNISRGNRAAMDTFMAKCLDNKVRTTALGVQMAVTSQPNGDIAFLNWMYNLRANWPLKHMMRLRNLLHGSLEELILFHSFEQGAVSLPWKVPAEQDQRFLRDGASTIDLKDTFAGI